MSTLSARFTQSPSELKRYSLDYSQQLSTGEAITGVVANVTSPTNAPPSPPFVVTGIAIAPGGLQAIFYVSGGVDQNSYEVQFLATTSLAQTWEDIAQFDLRAKV